MKAVVFDRYGPPDVLRIEDVERPVPKADEVLVRVHATTVTRSDTGFRSAHPYPLLVRLLSGLRRPRRTIYASFPSGLVIPGSELAGEVAEVGAAVREFQVGDRVFGVSAGTFGANAEFICMRESAPLAHMPAATTFEQAAAVCDGAILALMGMRPANVRKGGKILVYGASGSIGTAAVQLARYFEADVTGVCGTRNVELVRSLGADRVIDYTHEDFTKNGETYDVIFDAVGKLTFGRCRASLKPRGAYVASDRLVNIALAWWTAWIGDRRVLFPIPPRYTKRDVLFLKQLIEAGQYRAVIDRRYPLEDVVEATRYVETQQKTGNVVLTVS
ncbi:MAG TPA: NAD(P)-dependent alcohol dehydrogenase [Candidatus Dormibacteraeota bacterium]|nr:NAD(P)-dependent alcohol dehydrogenase [Candidatus Dormibacteraeota bacterium]